MVVLAITLNACQQSTPQNQQTANLSSSPSLDSIYKAHLIPMDSANKMIGSYLTSIEGKDGEMYSLIMNADALRAYLSDTSIKNVKLMFSHTLDYINAGNEGVPASYKSGEFTIIMAGYNSAGNYIFAPNNMVLDRAMPCPSSCPTVGTASGNLLQ